VLAGAHPAWGLIDPKFTPCDLVGQSVQILELKLAPAVADKMQATVTRTLKGKDGVKTITLDLSNPFSKEHADAFAKALAKHNQNDPALFLVGSGPGEDGREASGDAPDTAFMHMDGIWVVFIAQKDGSWRLAQYDNPKMRGTWQGGTDMLSRVVKYVLEDPQAELPCFDGVAWDDPCKFGKLEGKVNACAAVDLAGDGTLSLFVACDNGDKFFAYDAAAKNLKDVTPARATGSKSKVFAWGDFNSDGKLDLASSDGKTVTVFAQNAQGAFDEYARLEKEAIKGDVVSLAVLAAGSGDKTGILVGTESGMLLWIPQDKAAPAVISDGSAAKNMGKAGKCLAADFDGDNIPDIIQFFEKGSILCQGKAIGQFEAPVAGNLAAGAGRMDAFVGDYDADGLLDIITVSADACKLWQNEGKFKFVESLELSGEIGYKAAGGAVAGTTCDFNNDGRQDFVLFYSTPMNPQAFFNRGFRSFGFGAGLGGGLDKGLPKDSQGRQQAQQAGCVGDFNGDGAQDMAVILASGECWLFPMASGGGALALRGVLPMKSAFAGPLTVTGWRDKQCLGAWNVIAGASEAFVAWKEPGPLTLKWQMPGAKPQAKEIVLEKKAKRYVLAWGL
jgi:hypothetical protein